MNGKSLAPLFLCGSVMSFKGKQTINFKQPIVQSGDWNAY